MNYIYIVQGVKKDCEKMEKVEKAKQVAMQGLRVKGKHDAHVKFKQCPSFILKMHLNSNPNGAQALISHLIIT